TAAEVSELPRAGRNLDVPKRLAVFRLIASDMMLGILGGVHLALPETHSDENAAANHDGTGLISILVVHAILARKFCFPNDVFAGLCVPGEGQVFFFAVALPRRAAPPRPIGGGSECGHAQKGREECNETAADLLRHAESFELRVES